MSPIKCFNLRDCAGRETGDTGARCRFCGSEALWTRDVPAATVVEQLREFEARHAPCCQVAESFAGLSASAVLASVTAAGRMRREVDLPTGPTPSANPVPRTWMN